MPSAVDAARLHLRIAVALVASVVLLTFWGMSSISVAAAQTSSTTTTTTTTSTTTTTPTTTSQPATTTLPVTTTSRATVSPPTTSRPTTTFRQATSTVDETTTTEATTTTEIDLLVPGDGSAGSESTTTTSTTVVRVEEDDGVSESTMLWLVVAGLVAIAVLIGLWTWRYWKATAPIAPTPRRRPQGSSPDDGPGSDPTTVF